jgi:hypothetical protein
MNDRKEDARRLFDIARSAHQPTSSEQQRVLRGVLARGAIAAGVTSASVGSAATKGLLTTIRTASALKILAGCAILGASGAGVYRVSMAERAPPGVHAMQPSLGKQANRQKLVGAPEHQAAVQVAPALEQGPTAPPKPSGASAGVVERTGRGAAESPSPADQRAVPPAPVAASVQAPTQSFPTSAPPSAAKSPPTSTITLTREARALAEVQRELREGRSTAALAMLAAQNREFAGGALGQEREAARIMALCAAGRVAEGRPAAERFLTANPGSPLATHLRSSCSVP